MSMIRIGFDDDEPLYDDESEELKHGDGYQEMLQRKKTEVFIPEKRIEQMMQDFDCVVVHDFGDDFHLSEEEREKKNKFYQAFKKFSKTKKKYRKLDEFVIAMREALECLDFIAENNGVYEPTKFKKLFFKGKITVSGLVFPKFRGKEQKAISWEWLTDFILSDEDPKLVYGKKSVDELITQEDFDNAAEVLFDDGELERILAEPSEEEERELTRFFDIEEDDPTNRNIVVPLSSKEVKKVIKSQPEFLYTLKEMKQAKKSMGHLSSLAHDLINEDIEYIAEYDRKHNIVSSSDMPVFKGDLTKSSDYHRYLMELKEWEEENTYDNYNGRQKTLAEIKYLELKAHLEDDGWNIRNIYGNKEKEKKMAKIQKRDKKRVKELKKKLLAVQNRRKRRMGEDVEDEPKKKKGKKKSKNTPIKVKSKEFKKYKKETNEAIDEFLLASAGRLDGSFEEYEAEALDFSWDNIMGGDD